jgi:hypothetical protein
VIAPGAIVGDVDALLATRASGYQGAVDVDAVVMHVLVDTPLLGIRNKVRGTSL